jgi:hypothetical protein
VVTLLGANVHVAQRARIPDSRPCIAPAAPAPGTFWLMRAVFSSWLIVIAVGLAYMLTIALSGR